MSTAFQLNGQPCATEVDAQADLLSRQPELAGCLNELRCQEEMARRTSAQFVLRLEVQREESSGKTGKDGKPRAGALRFSGELLDVDVGMISVRGAQGCSDCGLKRALPQLVELVQELLRNGTARPRGSGLHKREIIDTFALFKDGYQNPSKYGIVNNTVPACDGVPAQKNDSITATCASTRASWRAHWRNADTSQGLPTNAKRPPASSSAAIAASGATGA